MTASQINTFSERLEAKQADLMQRIQRLQDRLAIRGGGDALDQVGSMNERDLAVRDLALETRLLRGAEEALMEIRAGTFGRCAACDRKIPLRRLKAVPWSPYCIRCQEAAEIRRRPEGGAVAEYSAQAG